MDQTDSSVKGGVLIDHKIHEGKHQYEVKNVVKYKKSSGEKLFARKGDILMEINDIKVQDLTPDELVQMLAKGNAKLTVHKACKPKKPTEQTPPPEEALHPVSKESTLLSFSMEMRREEELEENEVEREAGEGEDVCANEDVCKPESEECGDEGDLLVVSMVKTNISVVSGRGCDHGGHCQGCHGTGCTLNDVVMVAQSSTVTLVPRGSACLRVEKLLNFHVEHVATHQYLRGLCSQRSLYASPNPEKITIYFYKSNTMAGPFKGIPVVLNFTDSNCFLRCCKNGERVCLQVETCEKQSLKQITKSDESALSFVFYMKADRSKQRTFESALHLGWFIQINNTESVEVGTMDGGHEEESFFIIIQK